MNDCSQPWGGSWGCRSVIWKHSSISLLQEQTGGSWDPHIRGWLSMHSEVRSKANSASAVAQMFSSSTVLKWKLSLIKREHAQKQFVSFFLWWRELISRDTAVQFQVSGYFSHVRGSASLCPDEITSALLGCENVWFPDLPHFRGVQ